MQVPVALHTRFVPQVVPGVTIAVSVQTGAPDAHEIAAVWHVDPVHVAPALHATQLPALHTIPLPHGVPLSTFVPRSAHVVAPKESQRKAP